MFYLVYMLCLSILTVREVSLITYFVSPLDAFIYCTICILGAGSHTFHARYQTYTYIHMNADKICDVNNSIQLALN